MGGVACMVALPRPLPFSVLEFQARHMAKHSAHSERVHGGEDVLRPSAIGSATCVTGSAEETAIQLQQHMSLVQRLWPGQLETGPAHGALLAQHPGVVGEGALVGRSSAKQGRVPALPLHIQHGQVADAPILWCPRAATEHEAERNVELASHVLLGAEGRPEAEVVDKVQEVIVCAIADDWREHFAQEAAFDPAKPTASVDIALLVVLGIEGSSSSSTLALLAICMGRPGHGLTKISLPVQVRPKRALQTFLF